MEVFLVGSNFWTGVQSCYCSVCVRVCVCVCMCVYTREVGEVAQLLSFRESTNLSFSCMFISPCLTQHKYWFCWSSPFINLPVHCQPAFSFSNHTHNHSSFSLHTDCTQGTAGKPGLIIQIVTYSPRILGLLFPWRKLDRGIGRGWSWDNQ